MRSEQRKFAHADEAPLPTPATPVATLRPANLSPEAAAAYIGLADQMEDPARWMLERMREGEIRGLKLGRYVVFPIDYLDEYLREKRGDDAHEVDARGRERA